MARVLAALGAGLLFGVGLTISRMVDPAKVLGFLDVAGTWDPSLALVMLGAAGTAAIGYRLVLRQQRPLLADAFQLPTRSELDPRLFGGAVIFGIGWGLAGICPGPAVTGIAYLQTESLYFIVAMFVGLFLARRVA